MQQMRAYDKVMTSASAHQIFFSNSLDSSSRLLELEQFFEYMGGYLGREKQFFEEEAHVDLRIEFLPLFAETFPPILHSSLLISTAILLEQEMRGIHADFANQSGLRS